MVGGGGAVALAIAGEDGWSGFLETYLVSFALLPQPRLGALFFVMLQHLTRAGWSVVVRRLAEAMAGQRAGRSAVLALPIVARACDHLYHWAHAEDGGPRPAAGRQGGLPQPDLLHRSGWWSTSSSGVGSRRSSTARRCRQDASGDPALTLRMERVAAPGMILFALTVTFAAFDLLMSLDPHWFSTIFGVYYFAGAWSASSP